MNQVLFMADKLSGDMKGQREMEEENYSKSWII